MNVLSAHGVSGVNPKHVSFSLGNPGDCGVSEVLGERGMQWQLAWHRRCRDRGAGCRRGLDLTSAGSCNSN